MTKSDKNGLDLNWFHKTFFLLKNNRISMLLIVGGLWYGLIIQYAILSVVPVAASNNILHLPKRDEQR